MDYTSYTINDLLMQTEKKNMIKKKKGKSHEYNKDNSKHYEKFKI